MFSAMLPVAIASVGAAVASTPGAIVANAERDTGEAIKPHTANTLRNRNRANRMLTKVSLSHLSRKLKSLQRYGSLTFL
jgi:hypothetical protein